jgi:hypothetical protein
MPGTPCDETGAYLPHGTPPAPRPGPPSDYFPYADRPEFELANFLFRCDQMSAQGIDDLMEIWAATLQPGENPPFADHHDLYEKIDSTTLGDAPWKSFSASYTGTFPDGEIPPWMHASYDVWYRDPRTVIRNQLSNPDFAGEIDYAPLQEFGANGKRRFQNFMSGNWATNQAVCI